MLGVAVCILAIIIAMFNLAFWSSFPISAMVVVLSIVGIFIAFQEGRR